MPANNEVFNKIDDEVEFAIEQGKLETSYNTLVELDTGTHAYQNKAIWEQNQIAFFKSPEISRELCIDPAIVGAYYFAKKIMNHHDPKLLVEYETYTDLLVICRSWKDFENIEGWNDVEWNKDGEALNRLEELINKYINEIVLNIRPRTVNIWCRSFCDAYKKIMSATKKYIANNEVSGESKHPHYRLGNAALILEFLYSKCFAQNISLIELQNVFINEYVLPASDGKGLGFITETQYTIAEIIDFNPYELVAWFITNEINRNSPLQYAEIDTDKDKKILFQLLTKQCNEYVEVTKGKSIIDTVHEYNEKLKLEKTRRNFTEIHIMAWLRRVQRIMKMYGYAKAKILEDRFVVEDDYRGMVISDSVGVGYGLAKETDLDCQCYVRSIPRLLKTLNMDITVDIANCSVIGYETIHGKAIIKRELNAVKPHFVLISLGGNDARQKFKIEIIRDNLEAIVAECIKTTKVIVALGIPETFSADEKYRKEFAAILPFLKQKYKIETILMSDALLKRENIQADGLHLKPEIQLPLAQLAVQTITPILKDFESEMRVRKCAITRIIRETCPNIAESLAGDIIMNYAYRNYVQASAPAREADLKANSIVSRSDAEPDKARSHTAQKRGYTI